MEILTPTQIGDEFEKTAKEVNEALAKANFIIKCGNGWKLTELGKKNGGIQQNYKGNLSVYWEEDALYDGSLEKALNPNKKTKQENNNKANFRDKFKAEYRTNDGHYVRSRAEVIISNWLFSECIAHAYEKRVPIEEDVYCDFYIPKGKIYIEFWGYEDDEKYLARKQKKREL